MFETCHKCQWRGPIANGACACLADDQKRDILFMVTLEKQLLPEVCPLRTGKHAPFKPVPKAQPIQPIPRDQWPAICNTIATFAKESDKGIGDTLERAITAMGGNIVKAALHAAGIDCGCSSRVAQLNQKFPYHPPSNTV